VGVIEAEQTEKGKTGRNDRLIAIAVSSRDLSEIESLDDLNAKMIEEIEEFFVNYNKERGKKFKVVGRRGPQQAMKLLQKSLKRAA
jgi:inorganic pyrophosphatase